MGLFKNNIGRPSNDTLKKRRIIYLVIILIAVLGIGAGVFYTVNYFKGASGTNKNAKKSNDSSITIRFDPNGSKTNRNTWFVPYKESVEAPKIIPQPGYIVIGWATSPNAHTATVKSKGNITANKDMTYYAITMKTVKATFYNFGLDYIEYKNQSCTMYSKVTSCEVVLPMYNKPGRFNAFWSTDKKVMSNLSGQEWTSARFLHVGDKYKISKNTTLYPNYNSITYNQGDQANQYRSIYVRAVRLIGRTIVEYENDVSVSVIQETSNTLKEGVVKYPWLFVPSKIFVLSPAVYDKTSLKGSAGLTLGMDALGKGSSYSIIDIKSDVDINGYYHELAHALDNRYKFLTGKSIEMHETKAFKNFYNSISSKLEVTNGKKISETEMFAAMVTNFIWHYKEKKNNMPYYGLKDKATLSQSELKSFGKIFESGLKEMGMSGSILTGTGSKTR